MTKKSSGESKEYSAVKTEENSENDNFAKTKLVNIVLLGLVFMTTGSRTPISIQKTVLYSAKQENTTSYVEGFNGDGYVANSILYAAFAASNFFAPWVIAKIGPRYSMLIGGLGYTAYSAQMLWLSDALLYFCALLNGLGASLLWTGQGNFLSVNTSSATTARDSGVFWSLYQFSGVVGNIAVYLLFQGVSIIEPEVRLKTSATFTCLCVLGLLITLLFRPTPWHVSDNKAVSNPIKSLMSCLKLLGTRDMMLLSLAFLYSGLEISFWAGVLPSSVSFTQHLGTERKSMMGLSSVLVSVGSMTGGLLLITLKEVVNRRGRNLVVLAGLMTHLSAYVMSFLFLPHVSPLGDTDQLSFISPNLSSTLIVAALMGLGDAAFNTQIISLVSSQYSDQSSEAFALVKLVQSVGVSVGFALSTKVGLYWQLLSLTIFATFGTVGFFIVERFQRKKVTQKSVDLK